MDVEMLKKLSEPFHPSVVEWKPGAVKGDRALALAYADLRAYMDRLDQVCGSEWSVTYEPWGDSRIICKLTIGGVTRSSTGETTSESERSEIGGTVAEAQSYKRACAQFGLGRYLYTLPTGWADYDPATKRFTDKAKARLTGILTQHYRHATEGKSEASAATNDDAAAPASAKDKVLSAAQLVRLNTLGTKLHPAKGEWDAERPRYVEFATKGAVSSAKQLTPDEADALIAAMERKLAKQAAEVQSTVAHASNGKVPA